MPEISATWAHNFLDPAVAIRQSFLAAQNASFLIRGEDPPEDSFLLGAGLSYHPNASDELFIRYDGAWAENDIHGSAISAGGKIRWQKRFVAGAAAFLKTQVNPGRGDGRGWHLPER